MKQSKPPPSTANRSTRSSRPPPSAAAPPAPPHQDKQRHVLVVGAGIVGSSTAFYLRRLGGPGVRVTLLDAASSVASAASGKAGGFLARDWSTDPLMREGFDLHAVLAEELGASEVGYRRMKTVSASFSMLGDGKKNDGTPPSVAPWLSPSASRVSPMGDEDTTAQVNPALLTRRLAEESGAELELGAEVSGLSFVDGARSPAVVSGVSLRDGRLIRGDAVVLALGPWLGDASKEWELPRGVVLPRVTGQRAHSVVLRVKENSTVTPTAVFASVARADRVAEPEFYPRPDGTVYVCGESDDAALPRAGDPSSSSFDEGRISRLREMAAAVSPSLDSRAGGAATAEVEASQACYLPLSPSGSPIVGAATGAAGLFVCGGHGCWGILKGPVSGKKVAEMVLKYL